ncbi:MAG TPA: hypothetical protein DIU14_08900, partial [Actinobacteria bacterium]|nr:hypothetical protein [Actinomycetota bacterium]
MVRRGWPEVCSLTVAQRIERRPQAVSIPSLRHRNQGGASGRSRRLGWFQRSERRRGPQVARVLIVGWDGADWRILDPLLEAGLLPNLEALIERGGKAVLKSTLPTHSWAAWPSFLTGVDPDDHGVYDILESRGGSKRQFPVTFRSIR